MRSLWSIIVETPFLHIMPEALMACGWLIVMGMLSVWRLLNVTGVLDIVGPWPRPTVTGGPPFIAEFSEPVT
jgi:hypothetical protein